MKYQRGFWQVGFFLVLVVLVVVIGVAAYLYGKGDLNLSVVLPTSSAPTVSSSPNATSVVDETELIKKAVYDKTGLKPEETTVTISEKTDKHAKGGISFEEGGGGAYFIAAKNNQGQWDCVYDGQAQPSCKQIEDYDFPVNMVSECMDSNGELVKR